VDRNSFQKIETELRRIQELEFLRNKAIVVVGNKIDLARSRAVSTQGEKIGSLKAIKYEACLSSDFIWCMIFYSQMAVVLL